MKQGKKNKREWHFGMKAHVGTDRARDRAQPGDHRTRSASDISQMPHLLHGQEREVYGDQAYWSEIAPLCGQAARDPLPGQPPRPTAYRPRAQYQRSINRLRSATRARGEHAFRVVKQLWGFTKVRYRGLAKNTARLFTMFALANLYMLRRRLMPAQGTCAL